MTTDQLKDLFEEMREEAVPTIQPPGTAAARRTLRRRRATTSAVSAAAAVVAIAAGVTVVTGSGRPVPRPAPAPPAASASGGPEHVALNAITDGRPAVRVAAPAVPGYEWKKMLYPPVLEFATTCVGTGEITLSITGYTPTDRNRFSRDDMRIRVACGSAPKPVREELMSGFDNQLTVRVVDRKGTGQSGFAFALTGKSDEELAPDDERLDVVGLTGGRTGKLDDGRPVGAGGGAPSFEPNHKSGGYAWHSEFPDSERYDLVMACRGAGTFTVELRRSARTDNDDVQAGRRTGKVLARQTIPCSAVPQRHEVPIPVALGKGVAIWEDYENKTGTIGTVAWALAARE